MASVQVETPAALDKSDNSVGRSFTPASSALLLFLVALGVRLAFLPIAKNNGTDAWARYLIAKAWLEHPTRLPSDVWLPLHFWLLGAALWVWDSESSARFLTALLGAATILPYWGILRRIFDSRTAWWSSVLFALFGFHIAYSVTTSSEAPTIFFLALGLYSWVRFYQEAAWYWVGLSGICFSAASLCRVEPWLYLPVLTVALLIFSGDTVGRPSARSWSRSIPFAVLAGAGAGGWIMYSLVKWRQPLAVANRSAFQSAHFSIQQGLFSRIIAVPGALFVTLSPLVLGLILLGLCGMSRERRKLVIIPALLAAVLIAFNLFVSVTENLTMARYTLMYSWLLIPYGFYALRFFSGRWHRLESRKSFWGTIIFFLVWQAGIIAGAAYGPSKIADKLSSVSPMLPLEVELRDLVHWLDRNRSPQDAVILDHFNYGATDVIRYAGIPAAEYYRVPEVMDVTAVQTELGEFLATRHPRFLVYSPEGLLRDIWLVPDSRPILDNSSAVLSLEWQEGNWRVYRINYAKTR